MIGISSPEIVPARANKGEEQILEPDDQRLLFKLKSF